MKLNNVLKEFILECEVKKYSPKTIKSYRNNLEYFFKYLEEKYNITDISEVTSRQIKGFFQFLWSNKRKVSYTNSLLKSFKSFFKYACAEEYISCNPCLKVAWGKEEKTIIKTFEDCDVRKMIDVYSGYDFMSVRNKTILAILIDTGIRNTELCVLKNSDIFETYIKIFGKGYKERIVGKSPCLAKQLMRYERTRDGYFGYKDLKYNNYFLSKNGKPLTPEAVERVVRKAGQMAKVDTNIRCSPHTLRHYFAQAQLRNNLDVYSLSRLMGHESIKITQRYLLGMQDKDIISKCVTTSPLMNL